MRLMLPSNSNSSSSNNREERGIRGMMLRRRMGMLRVRRDSRGMAGITPSECRVGLGVDVDLGCWLLMITGFVWMFDPLRVSCAADRVSQQRRVIRLHPRDGRGNSITIARRLIIRIRPSPRRRGTSVDHLDSSPLRRLLPDLLTNRLNSKGITGVIRSMLSNNNSNNNNNLRTPRKLGGNTPNGASREVRRLMGVRRRGAVRIRRYRRGMGVGRLHCPLLRLLGGLIRPLIRGGARMGQRRRLGGMDRARGIRHNNSSSIRRIIMLSSSSNISNNNSSTSNSISNISSRPRLRRIRLIIAKLLMPSLPPCPRGTGLILNGRTLGTRRRRQRRVNNCQAACPGVITRLKLNRRIRPLRLRLRLSSIRSTRFTRNSRLRLSRLRRFSMRSSMRGWARGGPRMI